MDARVTVLTSILLLKTELTSVRDTSSRCDFFVGFNVIYQNIMQYGIWKELKLEMLTSAQKALLGVIHSEFPLMPLNHLGKRTKRSGPTIHETYPVMLY